MNIAHYNDKAIKIQPVYVERAVINIQKILILHMLHAKCLQYKIYRENLYTAAVNLKRNKLQNSFYKICILFIKKIIMPS